jgi:hypothetical protein
VTTTEDIGGGFGVFAGAMAQIGQRAADKYGGMTHSERIRKHMENLHQVPIGAIQVPITGGIGAFQMNDLLSVRAGYMWSVRRLTASGYTAGSVIAYKGGAVVGGTYTGGGDPFPFSAAGSATIGRAELLLDQGDALIIVCTGITLSAGFAGVQINGAADCFERWYLPHYLGMHH